MAEIVLEHVYKRYGRGRSPWAVKDLSLCIRDREFLVFLGPSGCGKTSTLRMIAGLEDITEGTLSFGGRRVNELSPQARDIAMAFENYALYPTLTVRNNIAFPLRIRRWPRAKVDEKIAWAAGAVQITDILDRKPSHLSGGQQQCVSLARAIVREPQAFLFDEPLSHLDMRQRQFMRAEIKRLHAKLQRTMIYVTHDQKEAMALADRIAVMHQAELQQVGPPAEILDDPANIFVAGFVGEPAMNFLDVELASGDNGTTWVSYAGHRLAEVPGLMDAASRRNLAGALRAGIRPHRVQLIETGTGETDLPARVVAYESLGECGILTASLESQNLAVLTPPDRTFQRSQAVRLRCPFDHLYFFSRDTGKRINVESIARRSTS